MKTEAGAVQGFNPMTLAPRLAYERGRSCVDYYAQMMTPREIREAVAAWRAAEFDHAETSYFGATAVRAMRAYWLGIARGRRSA